MDLGSALRRAREEAGLTLESVARSAGVTRQALSRWELGTRPVRSDDADRVLAACGRDLRLHLVTRFADVDEELDRMAAMSVLDRVRGLPHMLAPDLLQELQATGAVAFTGAWAAAVLGLPALQDLGGLLISPDVHEQATVSSVLKPWSPVSLADGGPWSITWDEEAFVRNPSLTLYAALLGRFEATVAREPQLELRVATEDGSWRVVDPAALVPEHVDADVLAQWRKRAT